MHLVIVGVFVPTVASERVSERSGLRGEGARGDGGADADEVTQRKQNENDATRYEPITNDSIGSAGRDDSEHAI